MQTATVFNYKEDFTQYMRDQWCICTPHMALDDRLYTYFPLDLTAEDFEGLSSRVMDAYFDLVVEFKARMLSGTSVVIVK